jgi:hypothetical protein
MTNFVRAASLAAAVGTVLTLSACSSDRAISPPFNRVVLALDASGSFKGRQSDALNSAMTLLDEMSQRRKRRWEKADEIVVISLDAMPEVIWKGGVNQLKDSTPDQWVERFKARSDFQGCTDVMAAFRLAADQLEATPVPTERYLMVFSDLIHEPPQGASLACQKPKSPSLPSEDFPWDRFRDVAVSVLGVPVIQKMAWSQAAKKAGLKYFQLYSSSESAQAKLQAPPEAKRKVSEAENAETVAKAQAWARTGGVVLLYVFAGLCLIPAFRVLVRRFAVRRSGVVPSAARLIVGPVPPMRVPGASGPRGSHGGPPSTDSDNR